MVIKITSGWAGCEHICIKKTTTDQLYPFPLKCLRPFLCKTFFFPLFKPDLYVIQQEVEFHKPQSY